MLSVRTWSTADAKEDVLTVLHETTKIIALFPPYLEQVVQRKCLEWQGVNLEDLLNGLKEAKVESSWLESDKLDTIVRLFLFLLAIREERLKLVALEYAAPEQNTFVATGLMTRKGKMKKPCIFEFEMRNEKISRNFGSPCTHYVTQSFQRLQ
ncbi:unnamed protein product [Didymodactylos carnosus]|uniref:Uncharacterized protein n=1 Tax=Didymodactylos carnosus TaxID=1234261 RepID=A0A8S2LJE6_9BILA|nr:unnamed protein product [Didymodactylos carnosus]CAF3904162.1 unnamed protein product [Didymodactylos carnosus]